MRKYLYFIIPLALVIGVVAALNMSGSQNLEGDTAPLEALNVKPGNVVSSPLTVSGKAPGPWFFEASFPVALLDGSGNEIARTHAQAQDDWMTPNSVPFSARITFTSPAGDTGFLVLEKDNPSGLAENAGEVRIPIRFR